MSTNDTVSTRHGSAVITLPSDTEILITRVFDAPAHLVFKALTTPDLVKRWWASPRRGGMCATSTCAWAASGASSSPKATWRYNQPQLQPAASGPAASPGHLVDKLIL